MDIDREITTSSDSGDSGSSEDQHPPSTASRLTFYDAFTLLVSLQVGSGVFSSPSQVNNHSPSPGASLIIWAICGAVAWTGAASFAELGAAMPVNGGLQEYLHEMYGSYMAFLASWVWIFATKPSSMAILSIVCAKYWTEVFLPANDEELFWLNKIIAISALAMMIFFNSISTRATSRLANVFLIIKLLTVALLLVCCLVFIVFGFHVGTNTPNRDWITKNWFQYRNEGEDFSFIDWNSASQWSKIGEITMAIYAGLWAYAGWDNVRVMEGFQIARTDEYLQANMVAGEMQDAAKELPAAIHTAVPAVIVCFLCANLSYYILIPWNVIGASDTVAEVSASRLVHSAHDPLI
jgi:L-type amino acid transporter 9